jgi:hypothetical protein
MSPVFRGGMEHVAIAIIYSASQMLLRSARDSLISQAAPAVILEKC